MASQTSEGTAGTVAATPLKTLVLNAALAYALAQLIVVFIHELSHVAAGLALGYSNELLPYGVTHIPEPPRGDAAVMALTGPVFSLVIGVLAVYVQPFRRGRGFAHLLWVWFAHICVVEGVGYLVLTPFGIGDTGSTAAAYQVSPLITWPCLLIGVATMFWMALSFARLAVRHTPGDLRSLRGFTFYPWIPGVIFAVVLQLAVFARVEVNFGPGPMIAVLTASVSLGVFAPMAVSFSHRMATRNPAWAGTELLQLPPIPVAGIIMLFLMLVVNLVILAPGLPIG